MTYTIEDVKRLVPEAGEVYQGTDYIEVVVNGFTFTVRHPMVKALLDTRRKLEVAREGLDRASNVLGWIGTIESDKDWNLAIEQAKSAEKAVDEALDVINKELS